jgi:Transmembrane domain of unknown function (DUF3566)
MGSRPTPGPITSGAPTGVGRKVRLTLARVDPWSVLKLSFLLSVAMGIGLVVGSVLLWTVLDGMHVFNDINSTLKEIGGKESTFDIFKIVGLGRVVSLATFISVINVVLIMGLATLGAFLYNLAAGLVGGINVTLSDE